MNSLNNSGLEQKNEQMSANEHISIKFLECIRSLIGLANRRQGIKLNCLENDKNAIKQIEDLEVEDNNRQLIAHTSKNNVNINGFIQTNNSKEFNQILYLKQANFDQINIDVRNNPKELIPLINQQHLEIWKCCLKNQYDQPIGNCVIKEIENPYQNQFEIWIIGAVCDTQNVKNQIEAEFQKYDSSYLECTIHDKLTLENLYNKDLDGIFGKLVTQLIKPFQNTVNLKIELIDKSLKLIRFLLIYQKLNGYHGLWKIKDVLQKEFVNRLQSTKMLKDFLMVLKYVDMNQFDFERNYSVIMTTNTSNKTFLTCLPEQLKVIQEQYEYYKKRVGEQHMSSTIVLKSALILNRWNKQIFERKYILPKTVNQRTSSECIELNGPAGVVERTVQEINTLLKSWEKLIIRQPLELVEKEVQYFKKKLQTEQKQLEKQYECLITTTQQENFRQDFIPAATLIANDKKMNIVMADISNFKCDAIVNSCNEWMSFGDLTMLTGVAQKIFQMGGLPYQKFCNSYISKYGKLKPGQAIIYEVPNNQYLKYIINVSPPINSSGAQTHIDMKTIIETIKSILTIAQDNQVNSLAIPIIGGGSAGYNFSHVATLILNTLIDLHFNNKSQLSEISIVEQSETKIKIAQQIIQKILKPHQVVQQDQYLWHWQDQSSFKPYDDIGINQQINEAYAAYLQNAQLNEIRLEFPFSKSPGTHQVDLINSTVTDIEYTNKIQILTVQTLNGDNIFYLDNAPLDSCLNEYFIIQKLNKVYRFQIFIKRHKIVFSKNQVEQVNLDTGYKRAVNKTININATNQQLSKYNILVNQPHQLLINENPKTQQVTQRVEEQLVIETFEEAQNFNIISKAINDCIKDKQMTLNLNLPNFKGDDFLQLKEKLTKNSVTIKGQLTPGGKIDLVIFKSKEKKITGSMNIVIKEKQLCPIEWVQQTQNFEKFGLQMHSQEYQSVLRDFKSTYANGQIFKISRIQNILLYQNYIQEKKKLLDNGNHYTAIEQERMLWHGVRTGHPSIIYEGTKEAFDVTYSQQGMWGDGIYFAERAEYSIGYSHTLSAYEDAQLVGKKVFLYCKVTTGRVRVCASDSSIRRPPTGFDSVGGYTNGSNVFILYQMDVRRAYPAYEVIYQ